MLFTLPELNGEFISKEFELELQCMGKHPCTHSVINNIQHLFQLNYWMNEWMWRSSNDRRVVGWGRSSAGRIWGCSPWPAIGQGRVCVCVLRAAVSFCFAGGWKQMVPVKLFRLIDWLIDWLRDQTLNQPQALNPKEGTLLLLMSPTLNETKKREKFFCSPLLSWARWAVGFEWAHLHPTVRRAHSERSEQNTVSKKSIKKKEEWPPSTSLPSTKP